MKTIFEEIKVNKNGRLENVPINYEKSDGTTVNAKQTTYNVVIAGRFEKKIAKTKKNGEKVITIKLASESYVDPIYGIPVTEDPVYIDFSNNARYSNTDADKAEKFPESVGSWILIKGTRIDEVNDETGEIRSMYYGNQIKFPSNLPFHFKDNCYIISGTAIPKNEGISIPIKGWNSLKREEYTYWGNFKPTTPDALPEDVKAEIESTTEINEVGISKNHYKRVAIVVKEANLDITENATTGAREKAEGTFESITVIPSNPRPAKESPTITGAEITNGTSETPAAI